MKNQETDNKKKNLFLVKFKIEGGTGFSDYKAKKFKAKKFKKLVKEDCGMTPEILEVTEFGTNEEAFRDAIINSLMNEKKSQLSFSITTEQNGSLVTEKGQANIDEIIEKAFGIKSEEVQEESAPDEKCDCMFCNPNSTLNQRLNKRRGAATEKEDAEEKYYIVHFKTKTGRGSTGIIDSKEVIEEKVLEDLKMMPFVDDSVEILCIDRFGTDKEAYDIAKERN